MKISNRLEIEVISEIRWKKQKPNKIRGSVQEFLPLPQNSRNIRKRKNRRNLQRKFLKI